MREFRTFAAWEDRTGYSWMPEVRTKAYPNSPRQAVLLRVCDAGIREKPVFHSGMVSGVPAANGRTGTATAANVRTSPGTNNADNIAKGTPAMARLPFKAAYGSGTAAGNRALRINCSGAGFTAVPCGDFSTTGANRSGDNGALKTHAKFAAGATIIAGSKNPPEISPGPRLGWKNDQTASFPGQARRPVLMSPAGLFLVQRTGFSVLPA